MENKIPKIIHYCWFGEAPKPELIKKCIASWKKFLPDYEIKEWNETNYDISKNDFLTKAYSDKKWAFVADFARLDILYKYGGIYLDTDMEIMKNLDDFLNYSGFLGFEDEKFVAAGIIGSEKKNNFIKKCLEHYTHKTFEKYIPIPEIITTELSQMGLSWYGNQIIDNIWIGEAKYFYPWKFRTKFHSSMITEKTYGIHHWATSWYPWYLKLAKKLCLLPFLSWLGTVKNSFLKK